MITAGLQDGEASGQAVLSQGEEIHGLVRRQDVAIRGLRPLTDQEACGQIYAIGDPGLSRGELRKTRRSALGLTVLSVTSRADGL